jgi:hypothetical protein
MTTITHTGRLHNVDAAKAKVAMVKAELAVAATESIRRVLLSMLDTETAALDRALASEARCVRGRFTA